MELDRTKLLKKAKSLGLFIPAGASNKLINSIINFYEADQILRSKFFEKKEEPRGEE